jgi:hypothetical protein
MTTPPAADRGRAKSDISHQPAISATATAPRPPFDEPGAIERMLGAAELAAITTAHDPGCACWSCIERFASAVCAWWLDMLARRAAA